MWKLRDCQKHRVHFMNQHFQHSFSFVTFPSLASRFPWDLTDNWIWFWISFSFSSHQISGRVSSLVYVQASPNHISRQVHDCPPQITSGIISYWLMQMRSSWPPYPTCSLFGINYWSHFAAQSQPSPIRCWLVCRLGPPKLPLCLQEPLKLLIAFCANGPYALDKVSGKSGTGW